ncbi:MAG: A24 family peptidase [Burkholderiaceae bacterium]
MHDLAVLLSTSPPLAIGLALLVGLAIGSFLNVVIHRVPKMLERAWAAEAAEAAAAASTGATGAAGAVAGERYNLLVPGSACPHCGHRIRAWENVPMLGWLMLGGRCSSCRAPISPRYPIVELATGVLSALAIAHYGASFAGLCAMVLLWFLIALAFIDADTQLLPDSMTLPLLWLGLLSNLFGTFTDLHSAVIGAMAGYLLLWSIYWAFKAATGKEGMGYGDFKLLAALGAWFGWQAIPSIILMSSLVGAIVGIVLIVLARHGREVPMPFGPYLAGAGVLVLFFRAPLAAWFGLG